MAVSVTCTKVHRDNGKTYVRFSDKVELEFTSLADVQNYIRSVTSKDQLRALLLAKLLEVSPDGSNASLIEGRTVTVDLSLASNIVRVT